MYRLTPSSWSIVVVMVNSNGLAGSQVRLASEIPKRVVHSMGGAPARIRNAAGRRAIRRLHIRCHSSCCQKFILLNVKLPVAAGMPTAAATAAWSASLLFG